MLRFVAVGLVLLLAGCGGGGNSEDDSVVIATLTPASSLATPTPSPEPTLTGYVFPIPGGCLPSGDQLLPNAPRTYRNGFHEGLDLYESDNCTWIGAGTPVLAARAGRVSRADVDYVEMTAAELDRLSIDPTTPEALDRFRGRQVWIDHGDGVITRYAHLGGIAQGIREGMMVDAGQLIAYVGESGTPESVTNPGSENHLHFEVRLGSSFLGAGLAGPQVRTAFEALFGQ